MYSGSDSTESQNYTQWALNPSTYQNVSNEQVDWAALAHQWIIMKEAGPPIPEPIVVPPPPVISKPKKEVIAEGGEAPMDVVNEDDLPAQWSDPEEGLNWNQQPWEWNNSWSGNPPSVPPPKAPLLPTPSYNNFVPPKETGTPPVTTAADTPTYGFNSVGSPGYWTSSGASSKAGVKPHNKRYSKVNLPLPPAKAPITLDAAKRKQLPAWIRDGLEKMERDKIKQLDRDREKLDKDEIEEKARLRENALEILKSTVKEVESTKNSAFVENDESDDTPVNSPPRSPTPLTYEEMMLKVRRTMTEILLKVTNREIQIICREELQRHIRKMQASDQRVSAPTGANLSNKLGLGAYEESGDSSGDSDEESNNHGSHDSDSDLRDTIRRRKEEFLKIERDIEDRLADADRKGGDNDSRATTPDSESQVVAKTLDRRSRRTSEDGGEGTPPPPQSKTLNFSSKNSRKRQSSNSSDSSVDRKRERRDKRSPSSECGKRSSRRSRSRTPKSKRHKAQRRSRSSSRRRGDSRRRDRRSRYSRSRSRSYRRRRRSRSDSRSRSRSSRRYRRSRSRSYSSGRGKRSNRH
ncbi:PREDICTED: arginine/serine-rich protein PNISR [Nicrophorus vespilloides]|uniref:Arginine/serine-rich protein PNISR n=1 Tax=Nicrophorus vespilloides TaxID=110193 RepID=A0ABM1MDE8_NICVS|nr:PREDICTED: arginine/serine-rich protein PNISR [Nicrophorus vespilloides]